MPVELCEVKKYPKIRKVLKIKVMENLKRHDKGHAKSWNMKILICAAENV